MPRLRVQGVCIQCGSDAKVSTSPGIVGLCSRCQRQIHSAKNNVATPDKGCELSSSCLKCPAINGCQKEEPERVLAPEIDEKDYKSWVRPNDWATRHNIPETCPHCGALQVCQEAYPDEIYCWSCHSSTVLTQVPLYKGWVEPSLTHAWFVSLNH